MLITASAPQLLGQAQATQQGEKSSETGEVPAQSSKQSGPWGPDTQNAHKISFKIKNKQ